MSQVQESKTSFYTSILRSSITRPANTTAYTAGDVIAAATTDNHFTFSDAVRSGRQTGMIANAKIASSANQSTKLDSELWLFHTDIAEAGDNAAFAPTDAELLTLVGIIDLPTADWKEANAGAGATGNAVCQVANIGVSFRAIDNLYGVLVARNAYTPVSGEVITIDLGISRD